MPGAGITHAGQMLDGVNLHYLSERTAQSI